MVTTLFFGSALLALAFLLPGHYEPWLTFQQEAMAAAGTALLAVVAIASGSLARWPLMAKLSLTAALIPLVQWAAGQIYFASDGVGAAAWLAAFGVAIATGASLEARHASRWPDQLCAALFTAALLSAGMALAQWLQIVGDGLIDIAAPGGRVYANFGQPNHLALLLGMGLCVLARWYEQYRIGGLVLGLGSAVLGWVIVLTGSRSGWLFVLTLALVMGWAGRRHAARLRAMPIVLASMAFVAMVAVQPDVSTALDLSSASEAAARLDTGRRPLLWAVMWNAAWQSPWLGWGWQQVPLAQQSTTLSFPFAGEMLTSSHNILLDLMVSNGIPLGTALFCALLWWLATRLARCGDAAQCALWSVVAIAFVHALFEFPLSYLFFLLPVGLAMGALDSLQKAAPPLPKLRHLLPALGAPLTALLVFGAYEYLLIESATRTLRFVVGGIGTDEVGVAPQPEVVLQDFFLARNRFLLRPLNNRWPQQERAEMDRIVERSAMPADFLKRAAVHGLHGDGTSAARSLLLLCWLHRPQNCDESRLHWHNRQRQFPELRSIPFPSTPAYGASQPRALGTRP
jgi:O-antigen ligase